MVTEFWEGADRGDLERRGRSLRPSESLFYTSSVVERGLHAAAGAATVATAVTEPSHGARNLLMERDAGRAGQVLTGGRGPLRVAVPKPRQRGCDRKME